MPDGYKMELLQNTSRPNPNLQAFIDYLCRRVGMSYGLMGQYSGIDATGADYKAQALMSWGRFYEVQKQLENILDWILYRWAVWADRHGEIDLAQLGADWQSTVSWAFPRMDALDESAHQQAISSGLANLSMSYRDVLGADWKEKLEQIRQEIAWCKENGLPVKQYYGLISGGEGTGADITPTENDK